MKRSMHTVSLSAVLVMAIAAIAVGPTRVLPVPLAVAAYAGLIALVLGVVWSMGATKTEFGYARKSSSYLPGVLLLAGPLVLLLGASVTGEPNAARPGYFMFNTTALLLGGLILLSGFALLSARLWSVGERTLSVLGISAFALGSVMYSANLIFRYAVIASGAASAFTVADNQLFPGLGDIALPLQTEVDWLTFVYVWVTLMLAAHGFITYLISATYAAALMRVGWVGKTGGGVIVALGLSLAVVIGPGWIFLSNPVVEGLIFFLGVPFMTVILPYLLGVALLRHCERGDWKPDTVMAENRVAFDLRR